MSSNKLHNDLTASVDGMSRRMSRYRVRAALPGSYDETSVYSRRADAIARGEAIMKAWGTVETVQVYDTVGCEMLLEWNRPAPDQIDITDIKSHTQIACAYVGGRCVAVAERKRVYSQGPAWTVKDLETGESSPCGSAFVERRLRQIARAQALSVQAKAKAAPAMVPHPVQPAQARAWYEPMVSGSREHTVALVASAVKASEADRARVVERIEAERAAGRNSSVWHCAALVFGSACHCAPCTREPSGFQAHPVQPAQARHNPGKAAPLPLWRVTGMRKGVAWSFNPRAATRDDAIERARAVSFHPLDVETCERIAEPETVQAHPVQAQQALDNRAAPEAAPLMSSTVMRWADEAVKARPFTEESNRGECHRIGDLGVRLIQNGIGNFTVVYGKQVRAGLDYSEAAYEYGRAIMHALACEGMLDNREKRRRA